jgi:hypothetical protein
MQVNKSLLVGATMIVGSIATNAQGLLNLVDSTQNKQPLAPLESTWKDTRLINAQTTKVAAPGVMLFRVMHRFGNVGGISGGGVHTLYGFDVVTDIYLSFEFGICKNFQLGFGRSKQSELLDVDAKYKLLTQKSSGMPVSLDFYGDASLTPELDATFYNGADSSLQKHFIDRISYFGELILDRRFNNNISVELFGGLSHRNYVLKNFNPTNNSYDQNDIPFTGIAGRLMFTKHAGIVFEYFYIMSPYRTSNNPVGAYYNGFSIGYEVETGGHVFEINFSNMSYINENNFIPNTNDTWTKSGFKLGFSISRAFNI